MKSYNTGASYNKLCHVFFSRGGGRRPEFLLNGNVINYAPGGPRSRKNIKNLWLRSGPKSPRGRLEKALS